MSLFKELKKTIPSTDELRFHSLGLINTLDELSDDDIQTIIKKHGEVFVGDSDYKIETVLFRQILNYCHETLTVALEAEKTETDDSSLSEVERNYNDYDLRSGIDGFYHLYLNNVELFSVHDDELNKAIDIDGRDYPDNGFDTEDDHRRFVALIIYETETEADDDDVIDHGLILDSLDTVHCELVQGSTSGVVDAETKASIIDCLQALLLAARTLKPQD